MNKTIEVTIKETENSLPIKAVLSKCVGLSRREISRLKFTHGIILNGEECRVTQPVKTGDVVKLIFMEKDYPHALRMCGKPDILYEDEDLVIVNKPAGMVCHPTHEHLDDDMGTLLQNYYKHGFTIRAVGRLDKDVSGIMVYAKSQPACARLSAQRSREDLHKVYHAIAQGHFEEKQGVLEYALKRVDGSKQRKISSDGQKCVTEYRVLKEYEDCSFVEISILTGRTHQIRAGMASIGHPLCGDSLYGGSKKYIDRPALHCAIVDLKQPFTGKDIHVQLHEPEDMKRVLEKAEK